MAPTRGAPDAAYARQVAMYLAHIGFALSFETIGRVFNRDRTTVAHACRVVEDGRDDVKLDRRVAALELMCGVISDDNLGGASHDNI
jgi:chromosomal replication initiation ATPase DnaA